MTGRLQAVTPTFTSSASPSSTRTPTSTQTATATATPAVGEGQWSIVSNDSPLVTGNAGYSAAVNYYAGTTAWPATGGLLTIFFPAGLGTINAGSFYAAPAYASKIASPPSFSSNTVTVQLKNLAAGEKVAFYFGYNATGYAISTTITPLKLAVMSYSQSVVSGLGAVVTPLAGYDGLVIVAPTGTATITPTFTISATFSVTPSITTTFSVTQTFTETPVGAVQTGKVYSYPNPLDLKKWDKCTFRFDSTTEAKVTVFNLVGEPVREIPAGDMNLAQGWAIWYGVDDYLRKVAGGMYFVRVRTPSGMVIKKFTVLN